MQAKRVEAEAVEETKEGSKKAQWGASPTSADKPEVQTKHVEVEAAKPPKEKSKKDCAAKAHGSDKKGSASSSEANSKKTDKMFQLPARHVPNGAIPDDVTAKLFRNGDKVERNEDLEDSNGSNATIIVPHVAIVKFAEAAQATEESRVHLMRGILAGQKVSSSGRNKGKHLMRTIFVTDASQSVELNLQEENTWIDANHGQIRQGRSGELKML